MKLLKLLTLWPPFQQANYSGGAAATVSYYHELAGPSAQCYILEGPSAECLAVEGPSARQYQLVGGSAR